MRVISECEPFSPHEESWVSDLGRRTFVGGEFIPMGNGSRLISAEGGTHSDDGKRTHGGLLQKANPL